MQLTSRKTISHRLPRRQRGVTLVELMIGITLGLFVMAGVTTVYIATIKTSAQTIKATRLNQEIRTVMSVLASEVRRAGYWGDTYDPTDPASTNAADEGIFDGIGGLGTTNNPFTVLGSSDIQINDYNGGTQNCMLYSFDADDDGSLDTDEIFGFRMDDDTGSINATTSSPTDTGSCTSGTWENFTDEKVITVTAITFSNDSSQCRNNTDTTNGDCYTTAPAAGDTTVETGLVTVTIEAHLKGDTTSRKSLTDTINIRNYRVVNTGSVRTLVAAP